MSRLAGDMKGFVVLGVYRSTVKKQNKEKNTAMDKNFSFISNECVSELIVHVIF